MDTPSFKEDHVSQIPALQMLVNLGYKKMKNQNLQNRVDGFIVQNDKTSRLCP